jgi:hypothetical protein
MPYAVCGFATMNKQQARRSFDSSTTSGRFRRLRQSNVTMVRHRNSRIVRTLSLWLLLLCGGGCISTNDGAMRGQSFQCDPSYGFRPTCWRPWPEYCRMGPSQGGTEAPTDRSADWEAIPTPREEPMTRLPQVPREDIQLPPLEESWR